MANKLPDGLDGKAAEIAVIWEIVNLAYPNGEPKTNSERIFTTLVNNFVRAKRAIDDDKELPTPKETPKE